MCHIFTSTGLQKLMLCGEGQVLNPETFAIAEHFFTGGYCNLNKAVFQKMVNGSFYGKYLDVQCLRRFYYDYKLPIGLLAVNLNDGLQCWYYHVSKNYVNGIWLLGGPELDCDISHWGCSRTLSPTTNPNTYWY